MPQFNSGVSDVLLSDVLKQIGLELNSIAETVGQIEETVSRMATENANKDQRMMRDLQNIDMIGQSLKAIAGFSASISQSVSIDWAVDTSAAAETVLLADLAKRLSCAQRNVNWGNSNRSGEWEVFD